MITIDKYSPIPIYKQIILQIKKEIIFGRLRKEDRLPPVREMAKRLNVNVNTVFKAYEKLVSEGILESEHGKGYYVKEEFRIAEDVIRELRNLVERLKGEGIEMDLAMMLLQEVWRK